MKHKHLDRRKFIGALSTTAAGGLMAGSLPPFTNALASNAESTLMGERQFIFAPDILYLNSGTLGPCRRETLQETNLMWEQLESLPLKFYGKWGAEELAEKTRTTAARFLGCDISEIVTTTSTTNGMNAIAQGLRLKAGDRILTTDQEHGGGALCWKYFEKYEGVIMDVINIPTGEISDEQIVSQLSDNIQSNTRAISISHVFSSTGRRLPIAKISALARSKGILCIVDGAQAVGAISVNVKELGCHAYATSGHKWLMGPKGTGLLYLSKEVHDIIRPMQFETSYNTYSDSNGVVNLPGLLGLAKAIEYLETTGISAIEQHNLALRNRLMKNLSDESKITLASPATGSAISPLLAYRLPDNLESVEFTKRLYEIYKLSIRATHKQWFNGIRFSLHTFNTENEVDYVAEIIHNELLL